MEFVRRLISWGKSSTLIISLPRKWVKQNNLSADQSVKLIVNADGTITLIPQDIEQEHVELETSFKIKDVDDIENIRLKIITTYLDGWDKISLETTGKNEFSSFIQDKIEEILEPVMGFQIFGFTPKKIVIKNIISIESSNIFNLIKLVSDQTISLCNILIGTIEQKSEFSEKTGRTEWKNIRRYNYQITREHRKVMMRPLILSKMNLSMQDIVDFQFYMFAIYNIGEIVKYIIDTGRKYKIQDDKFGIINFFKSIVEIVRNSIDSFLFKETAKSIDMMKLIKEKKPIKRNIEDLVDADSINFHLFQVILDMAEKIMDYCEDVCLAALRRAM